MKSLTLVVFSFLLSSPFLWAQVHYRPPANPAFSVSGIEPNSVLRPVSVSELSANVLQSFDREGRLKPDLGIEFAPYWLQSRQLSWEEYQNPGLWQSIKQSFQLSGASVYDSSLDKRVQALGLRIQALSGRPSQAYLKMSEERLEIMTLGAWANAARSLAGNELKTLAAAIDWLDQRLKEGNYSASFRQEFRKRAEKLAQQFQEEEVKAFLEGLIGQYTADPIFQKTAEASRERIGFFLELAGAAAFQPQNEALFNTGLYRSNYWLSASYITNEMNQWTFMTRYGYDENGEQPLNWDAGLSFSKGTKEFEFSLETILRYLQWEKSSVIQTPHHDNKTLSYRIAANLNYHFNERLFLNLSMGKGYDTPLYYGSFFSLLGLSFDMFSPTVVRE